MGLYDTPPTRPRTYTTATPVHPNDLNEVFDRIIDLLNGGDVDDIVCDTVTASGVVQAASFKHTGTIFTPISGAYVIDPNATHTRETSGTRWTLASSTNRLVYPITLPIGERLLSYEINLTKNSAAAQVIAARLYKMHEDGTETALAVGSTNNQNAPGATQISESLSIDIAAQHQYYVVLTPAAGGAGDHASHMLIGHRSTP